MVLSMSSSQGESPPIPSLPSLGHTHSKVRLRDRLRPRCALCSAGAKAHVDTSGQIYMYRYIFRLHICSHTPSKHMCYPSPQSGIKGQTSAEDGWPSSLENARTNSRKWLSLSPEEPAGCSLHVPRLALPGVIQDSSVCRYGCGAGGARGSSQYSSESR